MKLKKGLLALEIGREGGKIRIKAVVIVQDARTTFGMYSIEASMLDGECCPLVPEDDLIPLIQLPRKDYEKLTPREAFKKHHQEIVSKLENGIDELSQVLQKIKKRAPPRRRTQ